MMLRFATPSKRVAVPTCVVATIVLLAGCDGSGLSDLRAQPPVVLGNALAYLDGSHASLIVVDPAGGAGPQGNKQRFRLHLGKSPSLALSAPRSDDPSARELLVLDPPAQAAYVVRNERGDFDTLHLGIAVEHADVSPDGRFAVGYQPQDAVTQYSLLTFPNTVVVMDLDPAHPGAHAVRLAGASTSPDAVAFAASMRLASPTDPSQITATPLALVFVQGGIVPVDLSRAVAGTRLPLTPDPASQIVPSEVLFTNNRGDALRGTTDSLERAFVLANNGQLYVIAITPAPASSGMGVSLALENVVTPDAQIDDAALYFEADGTEMLLAAAGKELILVNGYTGVATRFPVSTTVDTLVSYHDPSTGNAMALGYDRADGSSSLLRIDPIALNRRRATGLETLTLPSAVSRVQVASGAGRAILDYATGQDLGVLDLQPGGQILDLQFAFPPTSQALSPAGHHLWVATTSPVDDEPHLAQVQLDGGLQTSDARIDAAGRSVGRVGSYVWVDEQDDTGAVTFFPADDIRRSAAVSFHGILLTDLFDVAPSTDKSGGAL